MKQFEKGRLYQVRVYAGWIIAEYVGPMPAHTARGRRGSDGATQWHVPDCHSWKPADGGFHYSTYDSKTETRDVTAETLAEITRIKTAKAELGRQMQALQKELHEICH